MKKILGVVLFGVCVLLVSCDKASETATKVSATLSGGPADGQTIEWYTKHPVEAKAEANYCMKKYGFYGYARNIAGSPEYCGDANIVARELP